MFHFFLNKNFWMEIVRMTNNKAHDKVCVCSVCVCMYVCVYSMFLL